MKKVLILQPKILHYRKALYSALSEHYDLTVLHSGKAVVTDDDCYRELIVPVRKVGPFFLQSGVLKEIRSGQYAVVVAMFDLRWFMNIVGAFLSGNTRYLYWGQIYTTNRLANFFRDRLMRSVDGVILYSGDFIDRIVSSGVPAAKLFVAQNTIHIDNHGVDWAVEKDSFIFSGRAQLRKRVSDLIRAFADVRDRLPENFVLNIVGAGPENDNLAALAAELDITDKVIFHGEIVRGDQLRPLFHRAIAYVSPGPVGLGVQHSFAYGVPVVTHRSEPHGPEFGDLKHQQNAMIYDTFDELKSILIELSTDRGLSEAMGRNAYEFYAENRTLAVMVRGFRSAIDNVSAE